MNKNPLTHWLEGDPRKLDAFVETIYMPTETENDKIRRQLAMDNVTGYAVTQPERN